MAAIRSGVLGDMPTLSECRLNDVLSRDSGVNDVSTINVYGERIESPYRSFEYGNLIVNLYRHPHLLVPETCQLWLDEYEYSGDNYSAVPYLERHPCALESKQLYESALTLFRGIRGNKK